MSKEQKHQGKVTLDEVRIIALSRSTFDKIVEASKKLGIDPMALLEEAIADYLVRH